MKKTTIRIGTRKRTFIDPQIFVKPRGGSEANVAYNVIQELRKHSTENNTHLVRAIAEHRMLPLIMQPIYGPSRRFHECVRTAEALSRTIYPKWLLGLFHRNASLLRRFLGLRKTLNGKILRGDADAALATLDAISELSSSWWGIELRIHIEKELSGSDTKLLIKSLHEKYPHLKVGSKARDFLLLSESGTGTLYLSTVEGRLKEYQGSAFPEAILDSAAESCQLLPMYFDCGRRPSLQSLHRYATWSLFDQYMIFRAIAMENPAGIHPLMLSEITQLATDLDDVEMLNALKGLEDETDPDVAHILDLYTHGEYDSVVNLIARAIQDESNKITSLLEVYARSKIYTQTVDSCTTYFEKLASDLAKILMLDPKSAERAQYLRKVGIKFRTEAWAKSLLFHVVSIKEWKDDDSQIEAARLQTLCLGCLNTPKASHRHFQNDKPDFDRRADVPRYRVLRYANDAANRESLDSSIFPIYSDYLKTQARYLTEKGQSSEAFNFAVTEYLKNNVAFDYLPIKALAESVESLVTKKEIDQISGILIYHIYAREAGDEFEERKIELFDDYLESNSVYQPSILFSRDKIDSRMAYFLRHICVISQLDNIIQFTSNDEVIHERVAIIDLLIAANAGDLEELRQERDKVLETLFSEKLRAKIETGKLFVDVQALENEKRHVYLSLYQKAKSLSGGAELGDIDDSLEGIDSADIGELRSTRSSIPLVFASSEKSNILVKIFMQLVADFALNENFGLDKYLSAEIRHFVFESQLRSCFEKSNLITVQKDGEYLPNEFWAEKYNYFPSGFIIELNDVLAEFSRQVDKILSEVNDRFRIKIQDPTSSNIFDFDAYHDRVVRISRIVVEAEAFDIFFKNAIAFMWELAVESARAAQQLINDVLLVDVTNAIDELESKIEKLKGSLATLDLVESIKKSRTDFKNEVELVLNWFRFVGSEDVQSFERLSVVIEAAVSSFEAIFRHKGRTLISEVRRSEILLNYSESRALFISLFTSLENALRYGAVGTSVIITHQESDHYDRFIISNVIARPPADPQEFVRDTKAKWTSEYSSLSTREGGSGLYKINNLLTNASKGFSFDIRILENKFNCDVGVRHEHFDYRRQCNQA